jgi:hypothetical protein
MGITQAVLAQQLQRPQSFVSKFEIGERHLDVIEFIDVCEAIGADPRVILGKVMPCTTGLFQGVKTGSSPVKIASDRSTT